MSRSGQVIAGATFLVAVAGTLIVLAECVGAARTTCHLPAPHFAVDTRWDPFDDERPNDPMDSGRVSASSPTAARARIAARS